MPELDISIFFEEIVCAEIIWSLVLMIYNIKNDGIQLCNVLYLND